MARPLQITLDNFTRYNKIEDSFLDDDVLANATEVPIHDPQSFSAGANLFVMIGTPGLENTEIKQIQSVAGNVLTVTALDRGHPINDTVTLLAANKLKIWRAAAVPGVAAPPAADFAVYGTSIDIDYDNLTTRYIDPDGGTPGSYWYGYTFLNSATGAESNIEDSEFVRGGSLTDYATLDAIRSEAGFGKNRNITDTIVAEARIDAQAVVDGMLAGRYTVPFTSPVNALVSRITKILAAGYLQLTQYGAFNTANTNNGQDKVDWAFDQLEKMKAGDIVIVNPDGSIPSNPGSGGSSSDLGFSGYPNGDTEQPDGSEGFMFERTVIDGYNGRGY